MSTQPFTTEFLSDARRNDLYVAAAAVRTSRVSVVSQPASNLRSVVNAAARLLAFMRSATHKAPVVAGR